ncbi:DUF2478 domain-containing protein [Phaeovulum sp. W22_SRMD_FR3]|uniref:DUF2478 domain-containing protein n=1 Tax=Phaeovulum sp. W22_SRMD_FR3 TaxID=3240274 RepID=UPI003F97F215
MLGFFTAAEAEGDALLRDLAAVLQAAGTPVLGMVQYSEDPEATGCDPCTMGLRFLPEGDEMLISQPLGPLATGCRLDAGALEMAVARVTAAFEAAEAAPGGFQGVLLLNKFGRQEALGRGCRALLARASLSGARVVISVPAAQRAAFDAFAEDLAVEWPADLTALSRILHAAAGPCAMDAET